MLKRSALSLCALIFLIFLTFFIQANQRIVSGQNVTQSVDIVSDIVVQNVSGETTTTLTNRQSVVLNISWDASNITTGLKAGDYLEVSVPNEFRFPTDDAHANFEIFAPNQIPAGRVVVTNGTDQNPGTIRLTFYEYVEGKTKLKGKLSFGARIDVSKGQQGNVTEVVIQTDFEESYTLSIVLDVIDFTTENILKWAGQIENEETMHWNVLIILSGNAKNNVQVIDSIANGSVSYLPETFFLTPVDFDQYGNITNEYTDQKRQLTGTDLTFNDNRTSMIASLGNLTHLSYLLTYQTTFNPNITIQNDIILRAVNAIELSDQSGFEQIVDSGGDITAQVPGYLRIIKHELNHPEIKIVGAVFKITNLQDQTSFTLETTAPDGEVTSEALTPGDYRIEEVSVPKGYLKDATGITVQIEDGETTVQTITNRKVPDIPPTGFPVNNP